MFDWVKKHWKLLAGIAIGVPVLYYLYQQYQSNQSSAQSASLQNQEQADEANYAQQIALANIGGGGGGSGATSTMPAPSESSNTGPSTTTAGTTGVSTPVAPAGNTPTSSGPPQPGMVLAPNGVYVEPGALAPLTGTYGQTTPPATTQTKGAGDNPGFTSTLFGSRSTAGVGGSPRGGGGGAQATTPSLTGGPVVGGTLPGLDSHTATGTISDHNNLIPVSPTHFDLASLGGHR